MTEEYMRRDVNFNTIHATNEKHFDIFFEILNIKEGQRLLDIGGGYGEIAFEFYKRNKDINYYYYLLDPSEFQVNKGKEFIKKSINDQFYNDKATFIINDFLQFKTVEKYDQIILKMVLQYFSLEEQLMVLKKAKSLLSEKGKITIWRPFLTEYVADFFSIVILKKDELAYFNQMKNKIYFCSEKEFKNLMLEADLLKNNVNTEPTFVFEYLLDTSARFHPEFRGNTDLYEEWLSIIEKEYLLTDQKTKEIIKLLKTKNGIILNFQRAIYQF
jgi:ubiquinone/menaquinone biosynthesis C-methylase UbiE